jgi:hypothetical protein
MNGRHELANWLPRFQLWQSWTVADVAMTFALLSILRRSQREPTAPTTVALT